MGTDAASASTDLKFTKDSLALLLMVAATVATTTAQIRTPSCAACVEWNRHQKPFRIFGNTYYVGTHGLSAVLITSDRGHILMDGDLPESVPLIVTNIQSLGFRIEDVKIILNSHVHYDHAGGISELQRMSGARVLASPWTAEVMRTAKPGRGDPQFQGAVKIAAVRNVHELHDGEAVTLGKTSVTAHFTPGHTPGGTSWTWNSCEGETCHSIVYADSLSPVSSGGFRFSDSKDFPHFNETFEKSFHFLETTPCDILISVHPEMSDLWDRLEAREKGTTLDPMVNPQACHRLAEHARESLKARLAEEQKK